MIGKQHILLVVLVFPGCQGETCVSMRVPRFGFCHENKELSDWMRKWEWKHSWVGVLRMILPWVEILTLHGLMQHIYKPQQTWWVHWYFHDLEFLQTWLCTFFGAPEYRETPRWLVFIIFSDFVWLKTACLCSVDSTFRWFTAHFLLVPFRYRIFCGVESSNFFRNPPTFLCYKQPNGGFLK